MRPLLAQFAELSARYRAYWPEAAGLPAFGLSRGAAGDAAALPGQRCAAGRTRPKPLIRALQRERSRSRRTAASGSAVLDRWPTARSTRAQLAAPARCVQARLCVLPPGVAAGRVCCAPPAPASNCWHRSAAHRAIERICWWPVRQRSAAGPGASASPAPRAACTRCPGLAAADGARPTAPRLQQRLRPRRDSEPRLGRAPCGRWRSGTRWPARSVTPIACNGCCTTCRPSKPAACSAGSPAGPAMRDGEALVQALQRSGARALAAPCAGAAAAPRAPLLLRNPPWARPFEIFSRALGMPSSDEADPTPLLAIVVPLMFGYMFGDVGQGLVIAAAGWWFRKRFAIARLLLVGGCRPLPPSGCSSAASSACTACCRRCGCTRWTGRWRCCWCRCSAAPCCSRWALALDALAAWWRGEMAPLAR